MILKAIFALLPTLAAAEYEVDPLGISLPIPKIGNHECQKVEVNGTYSSSSIRRPEGMREYYAYTPTSEVRAVVLNLHHLSGDCEEFRRQSCIVNHADDNGWLVVTPCGLPGLFGLNSWNAGSCCQTDKSIDDYAFMQAIIDKVRPTKDTPVHAVGYSNGAMLAEGLRCRNIVKRSVSISGVVTGGHEGLSACRSSYQHSPGSRVGHVHGLTDIVVPYMSGPTSLVYQFPSVPDDMKMWASNLRCKPNNPHKTSKGVFHFREWRDCSEGSKVILVTNAIGGHLWWEVDDFSTSAFAVSILKD